MPPQLGTGPLGTTPLGGALGGGALYEETVTFAVSAGMSRESQLAALGSVSLSVQTVVAPASRHDMVNSVGFGVSSMLEGVLPGTYEITVLLGIQAGIRSSKIHTRFSAAEFGPGVHNMMVTVGKNLGVSRDGN